MPRVLALWSGVGRIPIAPIVVLLALIVGISGLVVGLTTPAPANPFPAPASPLSPTPGRGGGFDLRPPNEVRAQIFSLSARVNGSPTVRRGPGTQYPAVTSATDGQEFHIVACNPGCTWLRALALGDEGQWWLPAAFLTVSGKVEDLPVLTPTESGR